MKFAVYISKSKWVSNYCNFDTIMTTNVMKLKKKGNIDVTIIGFDSPFSRQNGIGNERKYSRSIHQPAAADALLALVYRGLGGTITIAYR